MDYLMRLIYEATCVIHMNFWTLKKHLASERITIDKGVLLRRLKKLYDKKTSINV